MQAGANFKHILELTFKQQIFMIFIVDYFYQKFFNKKKIVCWQSFLEAKIRWGKLHDRFYNSKKLNEKRNSPSSLLKNFNYD